MTTPHPNNRPEYVEKGRILAHALSDADFRHGTSFESFCLRRFNLSVERGLLLVTATRVYNALASVRPTPNPLPNRAGHARALATLVSDVDVITKDELNKVVGVWRTIVEAAPLGHDGRPHVTTEHISRHLARHACATSVEALGDPFDDEEPEKWADLPDDERVSERRKFHLRILSRDFPKNTVARERGEACLATIRELGVGDISIADIYAKAGVPSGESGRRAMRCARSLAAIDGEVISSGLQIAGSAAQWFITYSNRHEYQPFQQLRAHRVEVRRVVRQAQHVQQRTATRMTLTEDPLELMAYDMTIHSFEGVVKAERLVEALANRHCPTPVSRPKRKRRAELSNNDVPLFELSEMPM